MESNANPNAMLNDQDRILVTGGAGFIGSHIVERLLAEGRKVRVLDDFSNGRRENLQGFSGDLEIQEGSITDEDACRQAVEGVGVVCHQAAFGSVPRSIRQPELYSFTNLHGFVNLCNAARQAGIKRVVYASSSSVYGDLTDSPKREERTGRPLSPYAASKGANELFAHSFASAYEITLVGFRYFNVFGPRQNAQGPYAAVIPLFIESILKGETPVLNGDGRQARDFTFIDNVVQANHHALFRPGLEGSQVFNVACGISTSVLRLYELIAEMLEWKHPPQHREERLGDVRDSLADISAARERLGYDPKVDLVEGLRRTVNWFRQNKG